VVKPDVWCRDADLLVEALGEYDCVCWDGSPPGQTGKVEEYVSSYTVALERALRAHQHLVCCAFVDDLSRATLWTSLANTFAGRIRFYRTGLAQGPVQDKVFSLGLADAAVEAVGLESSAKWTVYPAEGDEWGGMALTTPCHLTAGRAEALNAEWTLQWIEEEWRLC